MTTVPTLSLPAAGATVTTSRPKFQVTVPTPASATQNVQFEIATNSGFTTGVKTFWRQDWSGTSFWAWPWEDQRLAAGTYWWHARRQEAGVYSAYTASRTFTVDLTAPTVNSPSNNVTMTGNVTVDATPTSDIAFVWGVQEKGKLQLQVASNTGFTTGLQTVTGASILPKRTTLKMPNLTQGTWYWRVRWISHDSISGTPTSDSISSWSATRTLIISHPPTTTGHDPKNRVLSYEGSIEFSTPAGGNISIPDQPELDITGKMTIGCWAATGDWSPTTLQTLMSKSDGASQRSWAFNLTTAGALQLVWSTNGTSDTNTVTSTANLAGLAASTWKYCYVTLDPNNGSAQNVVRFWTSDDGAIFTQLGSTVTTAGVAAPFVGTATLRLGNLGNNTQQFAGSMKYAVVRNGMSSTGKPGGTAIAEWGYWDTPDNSVSTFPISTGQTATRTAASGYPILWGGIMGVGWIYSNPFGTSTATGHRVRAWSETDPSIYLADTGDVLNANTTEFLSISAAHKDEQLYWEVRVRDQDNVWSNYSPPNPFRYARRPVVDITSPLPNDVVVTPNPTVTWNTQALSGQRTENGWSVTVTRASDSASVYNSGVKTPSDVSYENQTIEPVIDLVNEFIVSVNVTDTWGLTGSRSRAITATYTLPAPPVWYVDADSFETTGAIVVNWPNNTLDTDIISWRVYRRPVGSTTWDMLADVPANTNTYTDYLAASGSLYEYSVVQVVERFFNPVETLRDPQTVQSTSSNYFLVCPDQPSLNIRLDVTKADQFVDEIEAAVFNVIGLGRKIDYGTVFGKQGTLECNIYDTEIYTAHETRMRIEELRRAFVDRVYLRTPFGDVFRVGITNISVQRIPGVGNNEYMSLSMDYSELADT